MIIHTGVVDRMKMLPVVEFVEDLAIIFLSHRGTAETVAFFAKFWVMRLMST